MSGRRDSVQLTSDATALVLTTMAVLVFITAGERLSPERISRLTAPDRPFELSFKTAQPETPPAPPPPVPRHIEKRQRVLQPAALPSRCQWRSRPLPPMPEKAFVGERQHTFLVTIEYQPLHLTRRHVASESVAA